MAFIETWRSRFVRNGDVHEKDDNNGKETCMDR